MIVSGAGLRLVFATEHDQEVADELCFLLGGEVNYVLVLKLINGHLSHTTGSFDDSRSCCNDSLGLLRSEHSRSDLLSVCQVRDFRLDDFDASHLSALHDRLAEGFCDFVWTTAKRRLILIGGLVGIVSRAIPHCRLTLNAHVVKVVLHLEHSFCGILNAPNYHNLNLNRGSICVVDLAHGRLKVHGLCRERVLRVVRVDKEEACFFDRA